MLPSVGFVFAHTVYKYDFFLSLLPSLLKATCMILPVSLSRSLHSFILHRCLLLTYEHVCMTEEMQKLAQTIAICLVCTIYMEYIFIPDMHAHQLAAPRLCFAPRLLYMA